MIEAARAVGAHTKVKPKDFLALLHRKGIPYAPNSTEKAVLRARRLAAGQAQPYYKAFPLPKLPDAAKDDLGL